MFLRSYHALRKQLLDNHALRLIGDIHSGGFLFAKSGVVITTAMSIFECGAPNKITSIIEPKPRGLSTGRGLLQRNRAGLQHQRKCFHRDLGALRAIRGWPMLYWWTNAQISEFINAIKLSEHAPAKPGLQTGHNERFLLRPWELRATDWRDPDQNPAYVPYIKGAKSQMWFEPLQLKLRWKGRGLELRGSQQRPSCNEDCYFQQGIAYSTIGSHFRCRKHLYPSVFDVSGASIFPDDIDGVLVQLNSKKKSHNAGGAQSNRQLSEL